MKEYIKNAIRNLVKKDESNTIDDEIKYYHTLKSLVSKEVAYTIYYMINMIWIWYWK